tara:strand:- start:285 stop:476 length:192 start_codon:yes stop_codon:yes gene_type:complete
MAEHYKTKLPVITWRDPTEEEQSLIDEAYQAHGIPPEITLYATSDNPLLRDLMWKQGIAPKQP